jgi:hypothetical protein
MCQRLLLVAVGSDVAHGSTKATLELPALPANSNMSGDAEFDDVERGRTTARVADDSQAKKPRTVVIDRTDDSHKEPRTVVIDGRTRSLSPSMRVDRAATAPAPVCLETVNAEELAEMKATLGGTPKNSQNNTPPDVPTPLTLSNYFRKWRGVPHMKRVDVGELQTASLDFLVDSNTFASLPVECRQLVLVFPR